MDFILDEVNRWLVHVFLFAIPKTHSIMKMSLKFFSVTNLSIILCHNQKSSVS